MNSTDEQSTPTWSQVWAQRFVGPTDSAPALEELIRIDGFDVGAGAITVASWREYSASIATTLGLRRDDLVFEIGCGAGALLLALQEDTGVRVCGMDFSGPLIATAQRALPSGQFFVADATAPPPPRGRGCRSDQQGRSMQRCRPLLPCARGRQSDGGMARGFGAADRAAGSSRCRDYVSL